MHKFRMKKLIERDDLLKLLRDLNPGKTFSISMDPPDSGDSSLCFTDDPALSVSGIHQVKSFPILLNGEVIGQVSGEGELEPLAELIAYLALKDSERKALALEVLDKYREINLLYSFSEKLSTCLDVREIARLVLVEARRLIPSTSASVMLYNEATALLEIIEGIGESVEQKLSMHPSEGIAGHIFTSGKPEIVNDVSADFRYRPHLLQGYSLICAPLMVMDRTIGVINISSSKNFCYSSKELKTFSALATQAAAAIENARLHENRLRQLQIKNNLSRYLSPQVVEAVINAEGDVSLKTSKRRITMLFSDIRNFSGKCETLRPEEIVSHLNEYFTHLVSVIFNHNGTVNKFVGDMIVAMFGAPAEMENQELQAIKAAVSMQRCISSMPTPWIRENFRTGIGISSGESIVGNIGSKLHMDYTAIGDDVNIAYRLQQLAQGGQILITRMVYDAASSIEQHSFIFREFGAMQVKGKMNAVEIFEVVYV